MEIRTVWSYCFLSSIMILGSACAGGWKGKATVDPRLVARALNDPVELPGEKFKPESVPQIKPPGSVRPCCAFGMDMQAKAGPIPVPFYKNGNILGVDEVGKHRYDSGLLESENNGLVYTCRGGFIDIAHIRDNADRTLYVALELGRQLPAATTINLPEEAVLRRVIIKPLPPELIAQYGRWSVATTLAQWINYQLSIWHEIATWYGWESIKGFSERLSAFSLEDLYSNVVGERLAAGIVLNRETDSREAYERAMNAWVPEALRRLGAVPRVDGRRAMQAVDGLWWDSKQRLPDNKLVLRRNLEIASPLSAWLVADAVDKGPVKDELKQMCAKKPPPLPLTVPQRIGDQKIEELVTIEFEFSGSWEPADFPIAAKKGTVFTQAAIPAIIKDIREKGVKELGPGFDQPRAVHDSGPLVSRLEPLPPRCCRAALRP